MKIPVRDVIDLLEQLPAIVHELRTQKGLSLRRAAEEMGIGTVTLTYFESGEHKGTLLTTIMILEWIERYVAPELEISRRESSATRQSTRD